MKHGTSTIEYSNIVGIRGELAHLENTRNEILQETADPLMTPEVMLKAAEVPSRYTNLKFWALFDSAF